MTTYSFNTKNRIDFLFIFDCLDGNPNGDPNMDNLPRQDPETGHGLVSDVAIKRRIRDYVEATGTRIYVKAGTALDETRAEAYKALGVDDADEGSEDGDGKKKEGKGKGKGKTSSLAKKDPRVDSLKVWMCEKFYDIRTFGAVMSVSKNCGQVRGPVQITFSRSVDPILPMSQAITGCFAQTGAEDKENQTMGRKAMMPYGLYVGRGFFSPALANQTGFSSDDFELLMQALLGMFEQDRSASRGTQTMRKVVVFQHSSPLGNARSADLFDLVKIVSKTKTPRSFSDYSVEVGKVDGVEVTVLG
jgi:CRISPR-associated protein Csd2